MGSPIQWTWTWADSGRWWGTGLTCHSPWSRSLIWLATEQHLKLTKLLGLGGFIDYFCETLKKSFISSLQSLSRVRLFATPWMAARQASLSITNSRSSLRLMSIESVMSSSHLILRRPLPHLPSIPPSIRVFSNESTLRPNIYRCLKEKQWKWHRIEILILMFYIYLLSIITFWYI